MKNRTIKAQAARKRKKFFRPSKFNSKTKTHMIQTSEMAFLYCRIDVRRSGVVAKSPEKFTLTFQRATFYGLDSCNALKYKD